MMAARQQLPIAMLTRLPPCLPAQAEVEEFYAGRGYLIPNFHKVYWMGLNTTLKGWPKFAWLDKSQPRRQLAMLPQLRHVDSLFPSVAHCPPVLGISR